jgi:uncharacterized SAM-binding protein YcdF (DUF218 family)
VDNLITQLISSLILPPAGPIFLGLFGLLFWRKRWGRSLLILALLIQFALSLPITAEWLLGGLQYYHPPINDTYWPNSDAQAIVVLGAGRYKNAPEYGTDTASMRMLSRLRYAANLARKHRLPVIPSGGTPDENGISEAKIASDILTQEFSVAVLQADTKSHNTWENARNTIELMKRHNLQKIILVTDAAHMPRAYDCFVRQGVTPIPAPINYEYYQESQRPFYQRILPSKTAALNSSLALHEYLGLLWYWYRFK